jgi:hypothetical protein
MKNYLEIIRIGGTSYDIDFTYSEVDKPIEINSVNKVPGVNLSQEFIEDCQTACAVFLIKLEQKQERN